LAGEALADVAEVRDQKRWWHWYLLEKWSRPEEKFIKQGSLAGEFSDAMIKTPIIHPEILLLVVTDAGLSPIFHFLIPKNTNFPSRFCETAFFLLVTARPNCAVCCKREKSEGNFHFFHTNKATK
jgi:hypothetical protein